MLGLFQPLALPLLLQYLASMYNYHYAIFFQRVGQTLISLVWEHHLGTHTKPHTKTKCFGNGDWEHIFTHKTTQIFLTAFGNVSCEIWEHTLGTPEKHKRNTKGTQQEKEQKKRNAKGKGTKSNKKEKERIGKRNILMEKFGNGMFGNIWERGALK